MQKNITSKRLWLILISSCCTIFSYAQFDDKFYFPSKKWEAIENLKYEEVTLSTDTVTLTGIFIKPDSKIIATIFFFHGGGGNNSTDTYLNMVRPLVKNGFQVFMIDFRGYGKSTGKPTHINIAKDGQFVFDYLLNRADVQHTKLILYGASMGTPVATKLAKENQTKISALVLDGAISSFPDLAANYSPKAFRAFIRNFMPSPYSPAEDIKGIQNIPKLIVISKSDKEVPFTESEKLFKNAKEPKEMYIYKGNHLDAIHLFPDEVIRRIKNMIEEKK